MLAGTSTRRAQLALRLSKPCDAENVRMSSTVLGKHMLRTACLAYGQNTSLHGDAMGMGCLHRLLMGQESMHCIAFRFRSSA